MFEGFIWFGGGKGLLRIFEGFVWFGGALYGLIVRCSELI